MSLSKSSPLLVTVSLFVLIVSAVAYGVFAFQQKKIDRLQAENQTLEQQITSLQSTNTEQQTALNRLSATTAELKANLQIVCQESQAGFLTQLENRLDNLIEHDFTVRWKQICQNHIAANSQ